MQLTALRVCSVGSPGVFALIVSEELTVSLAEFDTSSERHPIELTRMVKAKMAGNARSMRTSFEREKCRYNDLLPWIANYPIPGFMDLHWAPGLGAGY